MRTSRRGRQSRRAGRSPILARKPPRLRRRQSRRLPQHPRRMPPSRCRSSGLRVLELRLRRQPNAAVFGSAQRRSPVVALRGHQEGQRADGAQLQPSLPSPRHRAALLHRLRTLGPARHGVVPIHPEHSRRPSHRSVQPRPSPQGLHLHRRCRRGHRAGPRPACVTGRALVRGGARSGHERCAASPLQHREQPVGSCSSAISRRSRRASDARRRRISFPCSRGMCPTRSPMSTIWRRTSATDPTPPVEVGVRRFVDWYRAFHGTR